MNRRDGKEIKGDVCTFGFMYWNALTLKRLSGKFKT